MAHISKYINPFFDNDGTLGDFQQLCEEAPPLDLNTVGSYCVAKYDDDNCWYRAQIISDKNSTETEIFFIDYGNINCVKTNQLRQLPFRYNQPAAFFEIDLTKYDFQETEKEFNATIYEEKKYMLEFDNVNPKLIKALVDE